MPLQQRFPAFPARTAFPGKGRSGRLRQNGQRLRGTEQLSAIRLSSAVPCTGSFARGKRSLPPWWFPFCSTNPPREKPPSASRHPGRCPRGPRPPPQENASHSGSAGIEPLRVVSVRLFAICQRTCRGPEVSSRARFRSIQSCTATENVRRLPGTKTECEKPWFRSGRQGTFPGEPAVLKNRGPIRLPRSGLAAPSPVARPSRASGSCAR